jgi:hypothetical protein
MQYKYKQPSLAAFLCQPFLDTITRKPSFGQPYARAIDLIDVEERLYSIGAALGYALWNKLDTLVKLLFAPGKEDHEVNRIMKLCKKDAEINLKRFINEFGREPDTFADFITYRSIQSRLEIEGIWLSAKEAIEAYIHGDRKIKKIFDERVDLKGIEEILFPPLLQGINFGSSFPELTKRLYQKVRSENDDFWARTWAHGLNIPETLKPWSLEETQRAVLQIVAAYTSQYYPKSLDSLGLRRYLGSSGYIDIERGFKNGRRINEK